MYRTESRETVKMSKNTIHALSKFMSKIFISSSYVSQKGKNVKFYYCHSTEWCISVERMREIEKNATFPASVGHIWQEK